MAEYIIQGESLTALADEIRELSGTTEAMGLNAMKTHISEANIEINSQADLIAQIQATVDSLPEAGSGGGSDAVSVTISSTVIAYGFDADGNSLEAVSNGTYNFLSGIVKAISSYPVIINGTYIRIGGDLYRFSVDGGRIDASSGAD